MFVPYQLHTPQSQLPLAVVVVVAAVVVVVLAVVVVAAVVVVVVVPPPPPEPAPAETIEGIEDALSNE
jgi:hypothetical protein